MAGDRTSSARALHQAAAGDVGRMRRAWRWWVVLAAVAVLVALPWLVQRLPADVADVAPAELAARITASADRPYSGSVETRGAVLLPDIPGAETATGLLGGTSRLRVWVARPDSWRVGVLTRTGEQDMYAGERRITQWDSERRLVTRMRDGDVLRLPRAADLLPPSSPAGSSTVRPRRSCGRWHRRGSPVGLCRGCESSRASTPARWTMSTSGPTRSPVSPSAWRSWRSRRAARCCRRSSSTCRRHPCRMGWSRSPPARTSNGGAPRMISRRQPSAFPRPRCRPRSAVCRASRRRRDRWRPTGTASESLR